MLRSALLLSIVCFALQGCGLLLSGNVKPVPVKEVDKFGIDLARARSLTRGDRAESVVAVLGEPADKQRSCVPGQVIWRYPIRAWNDMANSRQIVPAVLLRVSFDATGTVTNWGFVDSVTGRPLIVSETLGDASRWFESLSDAPPPIPVRVELDKALIRGQSTQPEVEHVLGQWKPHASCGDGGPLPAVRKTKADSGYVWDWYVDRPSPLFIPPMYFIASFDDSGKLIVWHLESTYPGGRK